MDYRFESVMAMKGAYLRSKWLLPLVAGEPAEGEPYKADEKYGTIGTRQLK